MIGLYTAEEVRAAEAPLLATLPDGALMHRAATGLATVCGRLLGSVYGRRVVLLVGSGNNGGDALFAGAHLASRGARVTAVLLDPDRAHPAGLRALRRAGGRPVDPADDTVLDRADLVLDGIVGIGGSGGLRGRAASLAERAGRSAALLVAVDVPSGIDADTGAVEGPAFEAGTTVTFGAVKPGLVVGAGKGFANEVRLIDIGLDLPPARAHQLTDADVAFHLPSPLPGDDKYSQGVVGVVAGSSVYPGAAVLCTGAALRARPGLVRYAGTAGDGVRAAWPEAIVTDGRPAGAGRVQAWVVGPGMGTDDAAQRVLAEVLATDLPVLLDADALTLAARTPGMVRDRTAPTVLTPHDREYARFGYEVGPDRIGAARRLAADLGAVVLLKGEATVVAEPSGTAYVNATGTPWLATAGTGDVLSGIVGSLLATDMDAALAAAVGAHVHGRTGQLAAARGPILAGDLVRRLPDAIRRIQRAAGFLPLGLEDSDA